MTDILIKNGFIVTMDKQHRFFPKGSLYINDGKIVSVGKEKRVQTPSSPEFVIDAKNKVVLPGFVNTHAHPPQYLRGIFNLVGDFFQLGSVLEYAQDNMYSGLASCAELIYGGATTTCITEFTGLETFAKAVEKAGNRVILGVCVRDIDFNTLKEKGVYEYTPELADGGFKASMSLYKRWHGEADGRITTILAPHAPDFTTAETYIRLMETAKKYDLDITTHLSQTLREVFQVKRKYGKTPVEHLNDIGVLNERTSVAHCTYATEADTLLIRKSGAKILHCRVVTNPFLKWLDIGIPVGLGTDDMHHSMLPLLRQIVSGVRHRAWFMRDYSSLIKEDYHFPVAVRPTPLELLELATIKGAEVMGIQKEVGSLEAGKKADVIIVNMSNPFLTPTTEPLTSIIMFGTAADIDTVIVDGRILKMDGNITSFDMNDALSKAQKVTNATWSRFFRDYPRKKALFNDLIPYQREFCCESMKEP